MSAVRKVLVPLVLLGSLLLAGCQGGDEPTSLKGPTAEALPVSKATLLVSGPFRGPGSDDIIGTPTFVNGCLGGKNDEKEFIVVWPDGTRITGPKDDTIIVDGHSIPEGSTFQAKGYIVHAPFPSQIPDIPIQCLQGNQTEVAWVQKVTSVSQ